MRKTIKNRCEYLNRAWNRPRKHKTHVGMYWTVQNKWFFFLATNEPRTWSGGKWSCMCTHTCIAFEYTCLFAYFCDVTVTTTRRKSLPFVILVDWQLFLIFFLISIMFKSAYNEQIIRIRSNKSTFMSKFKLYIHYGRLLSLHQSSYPLVLLFLRQKKKKKWM